MISQYLNLPSAETLAAITDEEIDRMSADEQVILLDMVNTRLHQKLVSISGLCEGHAAKTHFRKRRRWAYLAYLYWSEAGNFAEKCKLTSIVAAVTRERYNREEENAPKKTTVTHVTMHPRKL